MDHRPGHAATRRTPPRTLWEQGHRPGALVAVASGIVVATAVLVDLWAFGDLTLLFDAVFVLVCGAAALQVRPRDFFVVGVFPPLLLAGAVVGVAVTAREAVADASDGLVQALVSGLAHHAGALALAYVTTLGLLALRQVAARHDGAIRAGARPRTAGRPAIEPPRGAQPRVTLPRQRDRRDADETVREPTTGVGPAPGARPDRATSHR